MFSRGERSYSQRGGPDLQTFATSLTLTDRMGTTRGDTSSRSTHHWSVRRGSLAVRRCWLAKAKRVCSPGEGKGDGSLLRPNLLPVGAFGKDHVTQASNFDTGVQDAAEVMHRLAPSGSMSLSTTRSQASPPRPGFVVGPRIG